MKIIRIVTMMVIFFENNGDCEKDAGKFVKIMRIVTAPALLSQDQQLPRIPLSDDRNFFHSKL